MKKIFIGIDISKRNFDVCILNDKEAEFSKYRYEEEQMKTFIDKIKTLSECDEIKVTMENTGIYHLRLANRLFENNLPVSVGQCSEDKTFCSNENVSH